MNNTELVKGYPREDGNFEGIANDEQMSGWEGETLRIEGEGSCAHGEAFCASELRKSSLLRSVGHKHALKVNQNFESAFALKYSFQQRILFDDNFSSILFNL